MITKLINLLLHVLCGRIIWMWVKFRNLTYLRSIFCELKERWLASIYQCDPEWTSGDIPRFIAIKWRKYMELSQECHWFRKEPATVHTSRAKTITYIISFITLQPSLGIERRNVYMLRSSYATHFYCDKFNDPIKYSFFDVLKKQKGFS